MMAKSSKMPTKASDHSIDCDWHFDQYPWECTCGAIACPQKYAPEHIKRHIAKKKHQQ
jgi:hypothetical protein